MTHGSDLGVRAIDPVLLGGGKRIFGDDAVLRRWRLSDGRIASTGAILATYVPAT